MRTQIATRDKALAALASLVSVLIVWLLFLRGSMLDPVHQLRALLKSSAEVAEMRPEEAESLSSIVSGDEADRMRRGMELVERHEFEEAARLLKPLSDKYPILKLPFGALFLEEARKLALHEDDASRRKAIEALELCTSEFAEESYEAHELLASLYRNLGDRTKADVHKGLAAHVAEMREERGTLVVATVISVLFTLVLTLCFFTAYSTLFPRRSTPAATAAVEGAAPRSGPAPETPGAEAGAVKVERSEEERRYGSITKVLSAEERLEQVPLLFQEGLYDDAYAISMKALELDPPVARKVSVMCLEEGVRLYKAGDLERALRLLKTAVELDPHNKTAFTYLANTYIKMDRYEEAVPAYVAALKLDPSNARNYYNLGICHLKLDNVKKALRALEVATEKSPMPEAHFHLAGLYESMGKAAEALFHWKKCMELAQGSPLADRARQRMEALKRRSAD